jgi:hypothetical protein
MTWHMVRNTTWGSALPVNFDILPDRVKALKDILGDLADLPFESSFYHDLRNSVEIQGHSQALGVAGEYVSFEKTGAG